MKSYCTQNNGKCESCSLANYGLDCATNPLATARPRGSKRDRALAQFNGHKGSATIAHVERNIESAYPGAYGDLTGVQYGKLMSVANTSYQDGKHSTKIEEWAYDTPLDWLAGIDKINVIEVNGDTITITLNANMETQQKKVYKLIQEV